MEEITPLPVNEQPTTEAPLEEVLPGEVDVADAILQDPTPGDAASVIREAKRLEVEVMALRGQIKRAWTTTALLAFVLTCFVFGGLFFFPKYRYIPTLDNAAICSVSTDEAPRVPPEIVRQYAVDGVVSSYSFNFVNWREAINDACNRWFTVAGCRSYQNELQNSGNREKVIKNRLTLRVMATHVPQLESMNAPGIGIQRSWQVLVPIMIEFYDGATDGPKIAQHFIAIVEIVEVIPSALNVKGIAINSIVLRPGTPG
jgi:intracellular multiplication protein IcmL